MTELRKIIVDGEWAYIVTDEETGLFAAHGSYGTFAYVWPPQHRSKPLLEFLASLDFDYFIGKTRGRAGREFDFEGSVSRIKQRILDCRRQNGVTREVARGAWDAISEIDRTNSVDAFANDVCGDSDLMEVLGGDYYEFFREWYTAECREFWRVIWPTFTDQTGGAAESAAELQRLLPVPKGE